MAMATEELIKEQQATPLVKPAVIEEIPDEELFEYAKQREELATIKDDGFDMKKFDECLKKAEEQGLIPDNSYYFIENLEEPQTDIPPDRNSTFAINADGVKIEIGQSINFNKGSIERYGILDKDCYTFTPERDLLQEIANRMTVVNVSIDTQVDDNTFMLYVNTDEQQSSIDLRFTNFDDIDASVPLTEDEVEYARAAIYEYECNYVYPNKESPQHDDLREEPAKEMTYAYER
jgi:hypothetical protein